MYVISTINSVLLLGSTLSRYFVPFIFNEAACCISVLHHLGFQDVISLEILITGKS